MTKGLTNCQNLKQSTNKKKWLTHKNIFVMIPVGIPLGMVAVLVMCLIKLLWPLLSRILLHICVIPYAIYVMAKSLIDQGSTIVVEVPHDITTDSPTVDKVPVAIDRPVLKKTLPEHWSGQRKH